MLLGHLDYPETYRYFLTHPLWQEALNWIRNIPADLPDGEHALQGRDVYAKVQTYDTLAREKARYEAHQEYIDLQAPLRGAEIIEWMPVELLTPTAPYHEEKDYTHYALPPRASAALMVPGTFIILFPGDAHMPKVSDNVNTSVRKVCIKIRTNLVR